MYLLIFAACGLFGEHWPTVLSATFLAQIIYNTRPTSIYKSKIEMNIQQHGINVLTHETIVIN